MGLILFVAIISFVASLIYHSKNPPTTQQQMAARSRRRKAAAVMGTAVAVASVKLVKDSDKKHR